MRRWTRIFFTGVFALGALALLVWAFLPTPVEVDVGYVVRGDLVVTIDDEGETRVKERYIVSSPLSGRLLRVELRPGDRVIAGETLLAVIEPADPELLDVRAQSLAEARVDAAKAAQSQAQSEIDRSKVQLAQASDEVSRLRRLAATGATTEREYTAATFAEQTAIAELRSAEFALRIAEFELQQAKAALIHSRPQDSEGLEAFRFEIPAPITGLVLRVIQESTTIVTPGTPLLELGDLDELEAVVDVLSTDAVRIQPGQRAVLVHWGGDEPLAGRVRVREPGAFMKVSALGVEEQRVNVIIDLVDPAEARVALGDGYRVEAQIVVWEGMDVLKVPAGALFRRGDDWAVFVVDERRAVLRTVVIGRTDGLETQVLEGLSEGDRVILHPTDRVEHGVRVTAL